jgi:glyoxylase-like metal-dependent hydrolase (beta-lactamase superfamily II)
MRRVVELLAFALLALAVAIPLAAAEADLPPDAVAMLKRAITAHGGDGPAQLRVSYRGTVVTPDQSAKPQGPFVANPSAMAIGIDEAAERLSIDFTSAIDGDFTFRQRIGFADGKGFALDDTGRYDELTRFPGMADGHLPHRLLKTVLATAKTATVARDGDDDVLTYSLAQGAPRVLRFDRKTGLLQSVKRPPMPSLFGDQTRDTHYGDYRRVGSTMVPGTVAIRTANPVHGASDQVQRLVASAATAPSAAELALPAGATKRGTTRPPFTVVPLGRDVHLLQNVTDSAGQWSYNVLAVTFADHVLIAEAPIDEAVSRKVIEAVARIAPGKPVRTLVQSHHHGDHMGGIRTYIAEGATIVAPQGTRPLIEKVASTHSALAPDSLAKAPRPARVEEVRGERIFKDAANEVRIFDVPNGHATHMLVVYLPEQRLLYQADFVNAGEYPLNAGSRVFLDWLRARRLDVATLAGLHGRPLTGAEIATLVGEGRLAGFPAADD